MIGYLSGRIIKRQPPFIVLEIQGIGYVVYVNYRQLETWGETVSLWIETVPREHQSELYGFTSPKEQRAFVQLQKVPGLGPKVALAILASFDDVSELYSAIHHQNIVRFKMIPGIGAKLASRIVQELYSAVPEEVEILEEDSAMNTALHALCALGYDAQISLKLLHQLAKEETASMDAESYVRHALKRLPQCS
ncbi:Holliday junction branch migration protein RuvA [Holospora curviuscula]|uniref:Holliday junction branch migration complex subunit RuvA n=1 Tax=Holospora curviuscula TaxID=1082868 RepID=A0A2S5R8D6_9PROT|nr:Holliday junction branch migration protein RuvA [Holospora curviuscula]PPE03560.1 Holliday junction ATP-dependent DNA helicase RuvA [Holospora curviuscula]